MRGEMARGEISTAPFASLLAHPGKPIFASGRVLTRFAPIRALFSCGRSKHAPIAIEHGAEELLQCKRVEFATAACRRIPAKHRPPVALGNSLPAQFITYQTRNSVQLNGATSFALIELRTEHARNWYAANVEGAPAVSDFSLTIDVAPAGKIVRRMLKAGLTIEGIGGAMAAMGM